MMMIKKFIEIHTDIYKKPWMAYKFVYTHSPHIHKHIDTSMCADDICVYFSIKYTHHCIYVSIHTNIYK